MRPENFDKWTEFYDLIYSDKDREDLNFYIEKAQQAEGKVLELGCGTGRIYLELLQEGADAVGIDLSKKMLQVLREKAEDRGLEPEVYASDMAYFDLDQNFDLIIIPFRSFLHNLTIEDQLATLENCKKHLKEGGELILNFFVPDPNVIASNDYTELTKDKTIEKEGEKYELYSKTEFVNEPDEIIESSFKLYKGGKENSKDRTEVWRDSFKLTLLHKREFELMLRIVGFSDWNVSPGFEKSAQQKVLDSFDQEMVWTVEK